MSLYLNRWFLSIVRIAVCNGNMVALPFGVHSPVETGHGAGIWPSGATRYLSLPARKYSIVHSPVSDGLLVLGNQVKS